MRTNILRITAAVLMAASITFGFTSCDGDVKQPEFDRSEWLIGKWNTGLTDLSGCNSCNYIKFNKDRTYSCGLTHVNEWLTFDETVENGTYQITDIIEKAKFVLTEDIEMEALLFTMLVSGSKFFDRLWVYHRPTKKSLSIHFCLGNELVQQQGFSDMS
jgi:hypothetical protein